MDCMEGMKQFPDKHFELAIVDPPYGINAANMTVGSNPKRSEKPYIKDLYYIRGILRNRFSRDCNDAIELMETAIQRGVTVAQIKSLATKSYSYNYFHNDLNDLMA